MSKETDLQNAVRMKDLLRFDEIKLVLKAITMLIFSPIVIPVVIILEEREKIKTFYSESWDILTGESYIFSEIKDKRERRKKNED